MIMTKVKSDSKGFSADELRDLAVARYEYAKRLYEAQDDDTKLAIDQIRDRLRIASTGWVSVNGRPFKLEQEFVDLNLWFLAIEIISELAFTGIRLENFEFPTIKCEDCHFELFKTGKTKAKRGR
jgi:hypothetical protein